MAVDLSSAAQAGSGDRRCCLSLGSGAGLPGHTFRSSPRCVTWLWHLGTTVPHASASRGWGSNAGLLGFHCSAGRRTTTPVHRVDGFATGGIQVSEMTRLQPSPSVDQYGAKL